MKKQRIQTKIIVIIGFVLIIVGLVLISSNYINDKLETVYGNFNVDSFVENQDSNYEETKEPEVSSAVKNVTQGNEEYLGILKIDKIALERGFYAKDSKLNNVNRNVTILDESDYPDKVNGNVILVAHSGSSYLGYFKNLYKLKMGDTATITYKGKTYNYKITRVYYEKKDGDITLYKTKNKTTLTLITCTKDDDTKQTVYVAERI